MGSQQKLFMYENIFYLLWHLPLTPVSSNPLYIQPMDAYFYYLDTTRLFKKVFFRGKVWG
jgi:hypothetical protein